MAEPLPAPAVRDPSAPEASLWAAVTPPFTGGCVLDGTVQADVAVIGGGFTGLSTALHLAEQGVSVAVVEAREPGFGASGRNNGQVIPTLTRAEPDAIEARHGEAGERFVALIRDSAAYLFDLVRRHEIAAEAEQTGWMQPAHTPGRLKISSMRVEQWGRRGAPVEMLSREDVQRMTGSDRWHGGFWNRSGGHINPLALARGLAARVEALGGRVFTDSPVGAIRRREDGWSVETLKGRVDARAVVLGTNAYTGEFARLAPKLEREVVPVLSWQMATAPLGDNLRATILPGRQALSDTHGDLYFMRYDARHRLVTGGALVVPWNGADRLRARIGKRLQTLFPQMGPVTFSHVWNGHIGMTDDYMPRLHRLGPDLWGWVGCNGRGVALSVSIGRELARAARGVPEGELALPFTPVKPVRFHGLAKKVAPLMLLEYRRRDAREIS